MGSPRQFWSHYFNLTYEEGTIGLLCRFGRKHTFKWHWDNGQAALHWLVWISQILNKHIRWLCEEKKPCCIVSRIREFLFVMWKLGHYPTSVVSFVPNMSFQASILFKLKTGSGPAGLHFHLRPFPYFKYKRRILIYLLWKVKDDHIILKSTLCAMTNISLFISLLWKQHPTSTQAVGIEHDTVALGYC